MSVQRWGLRAVLCAAVIVASGCNSSDSAPVQTKTILYVFATFPSPSVTVTVNGQALGQITKQYSGSSDCGVLVQKTAADGVLSFPVTLGTHYAFTWAFTGGGSDGDPFDATSDMVESPCLFEGIKAP